MAVILWKEGRFKICDEFSFTHELDNGWSLTKEPVIEESEISELKKQVIIEKLKAKKLKLTEELKE